MAKVQAARNKKEYLVMMEALEAYRGRKGRILGELAALWGLRIEDLLHIKYSDIEKAITKAELILIEAKTNKKKKIPLTEKAYSLIEELLTMKRTRDVFLFQSDYGSREKPFHRTTIWRWMQKTEPAVVKHRREIGALGGVNLGTHSLRKSGSRIRIMEGGVSVANVQKLLNHSNINTTLIYLDLDEEDLLNAYQKGDEVLF